MDQSFEFALLGLLPHVRAFSIQLCGRNLGEDIAQETLTQAWTARSSYRAGSKMKDIELFDVRRALLCLPADQREAPLLITASGFSYEQAASITATPIGTLKSRVSRARKAAEFVGWSRWRGARDSHRRCRRISEVAGLLANQLFQRFVTAKPPQRSRRPNSAAVHRKQGLDTHPAPGPLQAIVPCYLVFSVSIMISEITPLARAARTYWLFARTQ